MGGTCMAISIKVGVIGPEWLKGKIEKIFQRFPSLQPIYRLSDEIRDASLFVEELNSTVDCFLFSGKLPYYLAKDRIYPTIPAYYIPLKGAGLYRSLYQLKNEKNFKFLSIDGVQKEELQMVTISLRNAFEYSLYAQPLQLNSLSEVIQFHKKNYEQQEEVVVITSVKKVAEQLNENGILVEWLRPTEHDMIIILERLLLAAEQRRDKEAQQIIGKIHLDLDDTYWPALSKEQYQKRQEAVFRHILEFVKSFEGHVEKVSDCHYIFVATRGSFERITEGYKSLPFLDELQREKVMTFVGVGFGHTPLAAGMHADRAITQAKNLRISTGMIVNEDNEVIGPLKYTSHVRYPLSISNPLLLKKAEKIKLNAAYIEKTLAFMKTKGNMIFSAQELSTILGVTTRSAHRIIQSWLDGELIEIVGTSKMTNRGRPRQLYQFSES